MEETHFWHEGPRDANQPSDSEPVLAPRLTGRDVYLRAVTPADYPLLQHMELSSTLANRWRFRGRTLSPQEWAQAFWTDVLVQHLILDRKREELIGLAFASRPNFQDGFVYVAAVRF